MSKSVSNDALWEKLSEIEERINRYFTEQIKTVFTEEQSEIIPQLMANKDQITELFKKGLQGLGTHCDSHFQAMYGHIGQLEEDTEGVYKVLDHICRIMQDAEKHPENKIELKPEADKSFLNFKFFKVRKTTIVITILSLLVFILTLFCMKQQNEYVILNNQYYRKSIVIEELQIEMDSLKNLVRPAISTNKKR
jgi:hypothetical protein